MSDMSFPATIIRCGEASPGQRSLHFWAMMKADWWTTSGNVVNVT